MSTSNLLTSLSRARNWVGLTSTSDDALLTNIIGEVSRFILNYLNRPTLFDAAITEIADGTHQRSLTLRHWPVTRLDNLSIDGSAVPATTGATDSGYVLESWDGQSAGYPQRVTLRGYKFCTGTGNLSVAYRAGYKVSNEAATVPATPTVTAAAPFGTFALDAGVTYANGTAFTAVSIAPAIKQYTVSSAGVYNFASADIGASVLISYSYIPSDIEHACVALVAERYRSRSRIGEISKSLGGAESTHYSQSDMPEFVRVLLAPYKRRF